MEGHISAVTAPRELLGGDECGVTGEANTHLIEVPISWVVELVAGP